MTTTRSRRGRYCASRNLRRSSNCQGKIVGNSKPALMKAISRSACSVWSRVSPSPHPGGPPIDLLAGRFPDSRLSCVSQASYSQRLPAPPCRAVVYCRFRSGYSGGGRAGITPASLAYQQTLRTFSNAQSTVKATECKASSLCRPTCRKPLCDMHGDRDFAKASAPAFVWLLSDRFERA
jgi:hypothetical protein